MVVWMESLSVTKTLKVTKQNLLIKLFILRLISINLEFLSFIIFELNLGEAFGGKRFG